MIAVKDMDLFILKRSNDCRQNTEVKIFVETPRTYGQPPAAQYAR